MSQQIIREIIDNFKLQLEYYHHMKACAVDQLECLQKAQAISGEVQGILAKRQSLMEKIGLLNEKNREFQKEAINELGIDQIVLSKIKGKISDDDYNDLKQVIADLGQVLEDINEIDKKNQFLMMKVNSSESKETNRKKAGEAYKKVMQQAENLSEE